MVKQFGDRIKQLREAKKLLQRQVAAELDIDTPMLSKIERGERRAKKSQILQFAKLYDADKNELLTLWLADQVLDVVKDEDLADQALKIVSKKLKE